MKPVFVDVDTQLDFLMPSGALYVPGAEGILRRVAALNQHAAATGCLIISTTDAHAENDPEFRVWPPHCIAGCLGQQKPAALLHGNRVVLKPGETAEGIGSAAQVIVEKQATQWSDNRNWQSVIDAAGAQHFLVYGVVTEICVKSAVRDLLARGKRVTLVSDAAMHLAEQARDEFYGWLAAQGGALTTSEEVVRGC